MMGMDSNMMSGGAGGALAFFGWLLYLLAVVNLILSLAALWKFLKK